MWISNTATTAMMLPISEAVLESLVQSEKEKNAAKEEHPLPKDGSMGKICTYITHNYIVNANICNKIIFVNCYFMYIKGTLFDQSGRKYCFGKFWFVLKCHQRNLLQAKMLDFCSEKSQITQDM
jgi:hypothetical protein